ncbi:MAG TPA: threonine--tRNA ligase [Candidatus Thermoplasmatota archaeon]|nr:threonine--tRNA ligase [Candidatus Thermoplasmatota archaeon]
MKLLFIHSDLLEFEAKKPALKSAPPLADAEKAGRVEEALVVFYTVEKDDENQGDVVVAKAVAEINNVNAQVKAPKVVLYPYAHLSSSLASPAKGREIGSALIAATRAAGYDVTAAPFGYYKAFKLHAKGHPLAELSRQIKAEAGEAAPAAPAAPAVAGVPEARESEALKKEKKLVSHWYVLTPAGELVAADQFDFRGHDNLRALYLHETKGTRKAGEEPPHVRLMRELELVDYEPGSDAGNFRWYPKGQLVKRLLETRVSDIVAEAGGMRVETPIMYDYDHPALSKYLNRFPARQYVVKSEDKDYFLRFAACFGQYLIMHDMTISYKDLPVRIYELTHYSFRREQSGELSGLRRLRTFTMPDMHTLVADMEQAKREFKSQFQLSMRWMNDLGTPYDAAVRFVRSFFDENRQFAVDLAKLLDRPILLEIWDERFFYFVMKFEFNAVDSQGKASALSTVQIDVENTERFDINFTNEQGQKQHPLLLHASLSGSIDRNVYALLEREAIRSASGAKPALPFWLSPTQVRFVPVSDAYKEACIGFAKELTNRGIRADVDDRDHGVGRKIRDAEKEWIPAIVVYGEKEAGKDRVPVRLRSGEQKDLSTTEIAAWADREIGDRPRLKLPLAMRMSERPVFRG